MSIDKNFVIKNGLEVDAGTLYVNPDTNSVGVGTTNPNYNLEVKGIIGLSSAISIGGTTGISGQVLFSTGDDAEWRSLPNLRETVIEIATENQTTFPSGSVFDHNPLYLDVFLNGVKLRKTAEYNSVNNNTKVDILVPTYAGDVVELVTYSTNTFASGAQGIQGVSGQNGAQGATGPQGTDGAFAAQGITGSQGIQGIIGLQGIQGVQGTPGGQGIQGGPGIQGDRGVQGSNGPQGPQGVQGTQGQLGIQGPFGYQGVQGIQGTTGIQGDLGIQGPPGTGAQGIQGITGSQGTAGVLGGDGAQGIQGIQGIQGEALQGTQGTSGSAVAQGIQGIQGIQGPGGTQGTDGAFAGQGIQGIQGLQGIIGPQGTEGVGTQGTDGPTGPQGIQGTSGPQGTQGTLGLTGNQGIQGTQGIVGPQGANSTTVNYTLSETGAITRSFSDKLDDFVNALDFGLVEGSGQNSATQTANTSRLIDALETERAVYIPSGTYELNGEILIQNKNVTIIGDSERTTFLKWMSSNGANGIDWTTSSPERTLTVKNVRLVAAADKTGSPIYAKDLATTGGSIIPNVVLENVVAEYEGNTNQWEHGFQFLDCRNSYANRVVFRGNPSLSTDYGFLLAGTEIGCIDFKLNQCQVSDVRGNTGTAFLVRASAEGIGISNCLAINCNEGVRSDNHINADGDSTAEPFLSVHNCHFNVHVYGIYLERVLQSFITNNHIQACDFTTAGALVDWYGVYFESSSAGIRCSNIHIANNIFHANFPGRSGRTDLGMLVRYADHISVNNNQFMGCDTPGVKINSNVNDSEILNNRFDDCITPEVSNVGGNVTVVSFGTTTVNELGGGVNNISDDLTPVLGGNLDMNGNNITNGSNLTINANGDITADDIFVDSINSNDSNFSISPVGFATFNTVYANTFRPTAGGGTPSITSPNNINLNANTVAISTNVSVGGTAFIDGAVNLAINNTTIVGTSGTSGDIKMIGGAPFFHDGTAWREFALASGTPVTTPEDTDWDNVILRSTFDSNMTDVKFNVNPSSTTNADIVGSPRKVGTGALRIQPNNGSVVYDHRSDYDFEGEWTIEMWVYLDSATRPSTGTGADCLLSKCNLGLNLGTDWAILIAQTGGTLYFGWTNQSNSNYNGNYGADIWSGTAADYNQTWFHFALVRNGTDGSLHCFINGVEASQTSGINSVVDNNINNSTDPLVLGYAYMDSDIYDFDGFIDDLRISTVARYTSNFDPPTTVLPTSGTLSVETDPPGDKYGEMTLGSPPQWSGTSGVTVNRQSIGVYRLVFTSSYANATDYTVLVNAMDQGFACSVEVTRSTSYVEFEVIRLSNDTLIDTGSLAIQITNK